MILRFGRFCSEIHHVSTALDRAGGQPGDNLALREHGQQQHRQRDDQRRRRQRAPGDLIERQHVVDGHRQGSRLASGQHDAEHEIIPRENHRQNKRDRDTRLRDRRRDVPENLPTRREHESGGP